MERSTPQFCRGCLEKGYSFTTHTYVTVEHETTPGLGIRRFHYCTENGCAQTLVVNHPDTDEVRRVRKLVRADHRKGNHAGRNVAACVLCDPANAHPWDAAEASA